MLTTTPINTVISHTRTSRSSYVKQLNRVIVNELYQFLEFKVGIDVKLVQVCAHHFMTENIVILREERDTQQEHEQIYCYGLYSHSIGDEARSADPS